jgi:uncharacterized membrane protein
LAARTGYVQDLDENALIEWAEENDVVIEMGCRIGGFLVAGAPLLVVHGRSEVDESAALQIDKHFSVSRARTIEQDPGFGLRQIVDVALKALSPGINDSTTAATCVDYLSALIFHLAGRHIPPPERCRGSRLRLVSCGATFASLVDDAFHEIRQHAKDNVAVYIKLLEGLGKAARAGLSNDRNEALWRHAQLIMQSAGLHIRAEADRKLISEQLADTAARLNRDFRPHLLHPEVQAQTT